jgi:hypothetical protein
MDFSIYLYHQLCFGTIEIHNKLANAMLTPETQTV